MIIEISMEQLAELVSKKNHQPPKKVTHLSPIKRKFDLNKAAMLNTANDFAVDLLLDLDGNLHRLSTTVTSVNGETVILNRKTELPIDTIVGIDFP